MDLEEDENSSDELCKQLYKIVTDGDLGDKKVLREANRIRSDLRELNERIHLKQAEEALNYAAEKIAEQRKKAVEKRLKEMGK